MKKYITLFVATLICASSAIAQNNFSEEEKEREAHRNLIDDAIAKEDSNKAKFHYEEYLSLGGDSIPEYNELVKPKLDPVKIFKLQNISFSMTLVEKNKTTSGNYYLAEAPITQQIWEVVTGNSFKDYISNNIKIDIRQHKLDFGDEKPVYFVSEDMATKFINSLNEKLKDQLGERKLRLPYKDEIINALNGENNFQYSIENEWINNNGTINYINISSKNTQTNKGQRRSVGFRVAMDVE